MNQPPPPEEVEFGDDPPPLPAPQTHPEVNGSRPHPADEEWVPPQQASTKNDRPRPKSTPESKSNPHAAGRVLPHSVEAEEYLLSCCLLDGADVISRCLEARIRPESFYDGKHGIIYERLLDLYNRKAVIDISVVAEDLKTFKQLDAIGGYAFLTQVSSRIPTTAQAGFFIDKVREQSLLRELIRSATGMVEQAYNFSGGIEEFLEEQRARFAGVVDGGAFTTTPLVSITDFTVPKEGDESVLLGNRYLNRGDGAILVGTSGMGKSSMSIQMAILFALGRPAFGIPCNGPLRSLIVQSEDSAGDIAEIWASIIFTLQLTEKEIKLVRERVKIQTERVLRGTRFIAQLRRTIGKFKPDLVWLNPLQAFIDGDVTDSQDLGRFLREGLNGINPSAFGYIIVHHTTKPATGKDKAERLWHEVMYDMAGGAEIINWARAILSLRAATKEGEFNLVLAKRGRRAGVTKEVDQGAGKRLEPAMTIPLKHAQGFIPAAVVGLKKDLPVIFWEPRDGDPELANGDDSESRQSHHDYMDYRNIFPTRTSEGLDLAKLHRLLNTNKNIQKNALYSALQQWEGEGFVEVIRPEGKPMRYRAAI